MFEGGGQSRRLADPVQFFEERLNAKRGKMLHYRNQMFRGTLLVPDERVAHAGFGRKISGGVGEDRGKRVLALDGLKKRLDRDGSDGILRARGDEFVAVVSQQRKNFRAVRGREVRASGANGEFAFARGSAVAQIFNDFRAKRFHVERAHSFEPKTILAKVTGNVRTPSRRRSTAAIPRKARRGSLGPEWTARTHGSRRGARRDDARRTRLPAPPPATRPVCRALSRWGSTWAAPESGPRDAPGRAGPFRPARGRIRRAGFLRRAPDTAPWCARSPAQRLPRAACSSPRFPTRAGIVR